MTTAHYHIQEGEEELQFVSEEDRILNKKNKSRIHHAIHYQSKTNSYFLACYSVTEDEIYFVDFYTNKYVKSPIRLTYQEEKYNRRINILRCYWDKIQKISRFHKDYYLSDAVKHYFKRPINSKFIFTETKGLYSSNTSSPLPSVFNNLSGIRIQVKVHFNVFNLGTPSEGRPLLNDFAYVTEIPFMYSVELIIDSTIELLEEYLRTKIHKRKSILTNIKLDEHDILSNNTNNKSSNDLMSTNEHYIKMLDTLLDTKKKNEFKFVLKLEGFEDYLYGDNPISSFGCIKEYLRQDEYLPLVLFKKPIFEIDPPITTFPPIIFMEPDHSFTYFDLLDKYLENYPDNSAIFRFGELNDMEMDQFCTREKTRMEQLLKHTESGECDFPLQITIKSLTNLSSVFRWLNNEKYMKNEMMLFYFNDDFETKAQYEEGLFKNILKRMFGCSSQTSTTQTTLKAFESRPSSDEQSIINNSKMTSAERKKKEKERKKEKQKEKKEKKKALALINKSFKENNKLQRAINTLRIKKKEDNEKEISLRKKLFKSSSYSEDMLMKIKDLEANPFYKEIKPSDKHLKFNPIFIEIQIELLYGSYQVQTFKTKQYLITDNILINETITFDNSKLIISHLPREARLGISIIALNKEKNSSFDIGSCQIPLFKADNYFNSGEVRSNIWPFFKVEPRVNCCEEFLAIFSDNENIDETTSKQFNKSPGLGKHNNNKTKHAHQKSKPLARRSGVVMQRNSNIFENIQNKNNKTDDKENEVEDIYCNGKIYDAFREKKRKNKHFCEITVQFPSFSIPLVYTTKPAHSYENFVKLTKPQTFSENINDSSQTHFGDSSSGNNVFADLCGAAFHEIGNIIDDESNYIYNNEPRTNMDETDKLFRQVNALSFELLEKNIPKVDDIIKKDALSEITPDERHLVLACRDYISSKPMALEVFLRSVNWFNPLNVHEAHLYVENWCMLTPEDAIGVLDARFPDIVVRQKAIESLECQNDDIIETYATQLCQCLFYENHLLNPLADFIIEKCLSNKQLLGNKFYWTILVAMENPMFRNRLSAILVQIFAMSGPSFIEYIEKMLIKNEEYKTVSRTVKKKYGSLSSEQVERTAIKMIETWVKEDNLNFCLPIHPTYFVAGYELQKIKVFDSKMVPIKIPLRSSDGAVTSVIFKIGDDLRQDVLILQMFNVMDKMWLENELDLKISTYNVCPIELKSGFVEFVNANVLEGIQKKEGLLSGSMNKGTLYRYLMESSRGNEVDNFIRSLAGYCVATGLLGIGDRHSANVMVKRNGQFLHIDFGHIFGNFKKKFGFKRERSRFLLTPDMANVYITSNNEKQFNHYCVKAYNILRHNGQRLLNLLITMSSAGMPEFSTMADLKYFKHMLQLNKNDQDAGDYFINLIYESVNEKYRIFDNIIHNCAHK